MPRLYKKILGFFVLVLIISYFSIFAGTAFFYLLVFFRDLFNHSSLPLKSIIGWFTVGVSLALLASLLVWPFALAISTLLEHNKTRRFSKFFLQVMSYLGSLPLVVFVFTYISLVGSRGFIAIKKVWVILFASPNFFTEAIAFSLTLLLYPLTAIPGVGDESSIDVFYKNMLSTVIEFGEVGLVATVVGVGLFLYILPKMVIHMRKQLMDDVNTRSTEIIKSLGGTPWESVHLTVMQAMKSRFNDIILHFTQICFFEGLITFALLQAFFLNTREQSFQWSASLSSVFLAESLKTPVNFDHLLSLSGALLFVYMIFIWVDRRQKLSREVQNV